MNKLIALVLVTTSSLALADNSGQRPGPSVWVTRSNQSQYSALASQASSLRANLSSYNTRASTPVSSPAAYQALKTEQASLKTQVASYNSAVMGFAARNPVSPYDQPAAVAARQAQATQNAFITNLVASRARR
jgi:hypothetical protein